MSTTAIYDPFPLMKMRSDTMQDVVLSGTAISSSDHIIHEPPRMKRLVAKKLKPVVIARAVDIHVTPLIIHALFSSTPITAVANAPGPRISDPMMFDCITHALE